MWEGVLAVIQGNVQRANVLDLGSEKILCAPNFSQALSLP